jgi:uncharacterized membrane protein/nitrite reductase/ring-hydroxylating ferredoxin subunit
LKSKAHIKNHPLHPILVSFPIAFLTGAFLSDVIFLFAYPFFFFRMATCLEIAGILFAVLAAVPGIIDYVAVVPPESSAKKRATKHALLNFAMLLVFTIALLLRQDKNISFYIILILELSGVILLTIAGWLGGTLVHRNQIGVDHRYANAGKWKEETLKGAGAIELKNMERLGINQMKLLHVNDKRIVVARTESEFVAFDDHCTHRGASLADGAMMCGTIQCPWHGSQFNIKTGEVMAGPSTAPLQIYKIESREQKFYLQL